MSASELVLVIDDDSAIVDSLCLYLELEGFETKRYSNGDAYELIMSLRPAVVLLDVWLNGQDGEEICQRVKKNSTSAQIPVVLISAKRNLPQTALAAGADGYLEKPFDLDEVLSTLKAVIGKK